MANYNNDYEKLLASIEGSGQNWSQYDLDLAQKNPDAGWSIYESKNDWLDAQAKGDKTAMDAANKAANDVRSYYGNYNGGADGSGYTLLPTYDDVPEYVQYESQYADQIQDLYNSIQNRDPFSYSPDSDVSYQAYAEKYRNAGQKARDDTLGTAAAMTGGIPSTYAISAAQQAQNNYNAVLSDVLPQLEQLAYSKYVDQGNAMRSDLQTLMQMDDRAYQQHLDSYNNALNEWQLNYGVDRDRVGDIQYADETAYNRNQYERELALEQAMTMLNLGLMPSEELLSASKMNGNDVQAIYEAIRAQLAEDTSGKGSGSGGSGSSGNTGGMTYNERLGALYRAAKATNNPANYIATHFKEYGFDKSTGLVDGYKSWAANNQQPAASKIKGAASNIVAEHDANEIQYSANYNSTLSDIGGMFDSGASVASVSEALDKAVKSGDIRAWEAEEILKDLGLY